MSDYEKGFQRAKGEAVEIIAKLQAENSEMVDEGNCLREEQAHNLNQIARLTKERDEAQNCVILENKQLKERERQLVGVLQHIEVKCVDYDGYKNAVGLMKLIDTIKQIAETEESLSA